MFVSKLTRNWIAGIAAVMLLACQSVALAHQRVLNPPAPAGEPVLHSCHDAGTSGDGGEGTYEARCQSKHAFFTPSGANVPALDSLPPIIVRVDRVAAANATVLPAESRPVHIEPPPLRILHCCLRN
jgi:hypothetical protein